MAELKDNQFLYEKVVITVDHFKDKKKEGDKHSWTAKFESGQVLDNDFLAQLKGTDYVKRVEEEIDKFQLKRDKILEEREKAEHLQRIAELNKKFHDFKKKVKDEAPKEFWKLKPKFCNKIDKNTTRWNIYNINFEGTSITLEYDTEVTSSSGWYRHKTDKPWVVEVNFKKRRYKSLKSVTKRITEEIRDANATEKAKQNRMSQLQKFAKKTGLSLSKGWHSLGIGRGHETFHLVEVGTGTKDEPLIKFNFSYYASKPTITSVEISEGLELFGRTVKNLKFEVTLKTPEEVNKFLEKIEKALANGFRKRFRKQTTKSQ